MSGPQLGIPDTDWDRTLRETGGHFLQSRAWQCVQEALGHTVVWDRHPGGQWAAIERRHHGIAYLYCPYGPTVNGPSLAPTLTSIRRAVSRRQADFARLEPVGTLSIEACIRSGMQPTAPIQPRETAVIDLTVTETDLRRGLTKGHRSSLKTADRSGVVVRRSDDPSDGQVLIDLMRRTSARNGFRPHPDSYYRTLCDVLLPAGAACLYIAQLDGAPVAASIGFDFDGTRHYAHAAADPDRSRSTGAAIAVVWRMILDARGDGFRRFDLWGVAPANCPNHPWAGFTQFKLAFGSHRVDGLGAWDLVEHRLRYGAYRLARRLMR